ncbi:MAG: alkaline phosphatase family protein [Flavobacteriaceae bacterium]|nr:alkaline phosphatase family protein [Flavobacteriaceae bacterium]
MRFLLYFVCIIGLLSCQTQIPAKTIKSNQEQTSDFVLSFGSCNNQTLTNKLWKEIVKNNPDVWVWGGDVIYSDTHNMAFMKQNYDKQKNDTAYQNFLKKVPVIGTWDDHDYGVNDGGVEYPEKDRVKELFLDFIEAPANDPRRSRGGVYYSKTYTVKDNSIKVIVLDTRYFRTKLTKDPSGVKRYIPNNYGEGTMLGTAQWQWLKQELDSSKANFNIIESSIQVLSYEHGFETWGNMPHEVAKLEKTIADSKAKGVIILSGDRHIAEISQIQIPSMNYPLIDITSSGLTHSYSSYSGETNKYRISEVVAQKNFGLIKFDFKNHKATFEIRGLNNNLYLTHTQQY